MRHSVESIIPEILVEAAMPLAQHVQILRLFNGSLAAQPESGGLNLEFVNRALEISLLFGLLLRPRARREAHKNSERADGFEHTFDFTVRGLSTSTDGKLFC